MSGTRTVQNPQCPFKYYLTLLKTLTERADVHAGFAKSISCLMDPTNELATCNTINDDPCHSWVEVTNVRCKSYLFSSHNILYSY